MIPSPQLENWRAQFFAKHGERVQVGERWYFHDGSFCELSALGMTGAAEDLDPKELARNILIF